MNFFSIIRFEIKTILDEHPLDGRESPDVNHWNSINSTGDMDIDR